MIKFKNVSKSFKDRKVLSNISMNIEEGEFVCIIGGSGCGKTTALKMINRLIKPSEGTILVNGKDISGENEIELRRNIGYVIQQTGLFPHMTVKQNLELIPKIKNKKSKWDKTEDLTETVTNVLKMVGLEPEVYMDKYPVQLSGGQRQRIGVARAFASKPDIILMDEPFSALDPITRNQLQNELIELQENVKKTIVFVTHDMAEAIKLADRICILDSGKIQQFDTPEQILKNPENDFVSNFVGKNRIWDSPDLIKAEDIMIETPFTCPPALQCLKAVNIMREKRIDSLIVVDSYNRFLGKIIASDAVLPSNIEKKVSEVMVTEYIVANPRDSILSILKTAREKDIYTIPVVNDDGILVGLVTKSTLVTVLSQKYNESEAD